MNGAGGSRVARWMTLWGWMDIAGVVFLIGSNIYHGQIPVFSGLSNALHSHQLYGGMLPLIASATSIVLSASFIASGYLLIRGKNSGRYLAFAQSPFRILLLMPSLFFLEHIDYQGQSSWTLVAALVLTELIKIWSISRRPSSG